MTAKTPLLARLIDDVSDVCQLLKKVEYYLREAESRLFIEDVELAEKVRKLREELNTILKEVTNQ